MKSMMIAAALSLAAFATVSQAADAASAPMTKQQSKMTTCNADAGDKKGDERKAFMKTCLSAKKATPQEKMKSCSADFKTTGKPSGERQAFMKTCLSA